MVLRETGVVFLCHELFAAAAAMLQLDAEQFTHQRRAGRLRSLGEELLDARRASLDPGVLEAITDLIDLPRQRQGELFADGLVQGRTSSRINVQCPMTNDRQPAELAASGSSPAAIGHWSSVICCSASQVRRINCSLRSTVPTQRPMRTAISSLVWPSIFHTAIACSVTSPS